jgi:hypothetical protein
LAGKLIRAGIKVLAVEGLIAEGISNLKTADIAVEWSSSIIDIECKRPQTEDSLDANVEGAYRQLGDLNRQYPMSIIAIDCSPFIRPPETLIEDDSAEHAEEYLGKLLADSIGPKIQTHFDPGLLGFLLFARAPAMIREGNSPILSPNGNPYRHLRPVSI